MARPQKTALAALAIAVALLAGWMFIPSPTGAPPATTPVGGGALVASLRSEPTRYNRYVEATAPADLVSLLIDGRLVRVNRATDVVEPALAERWATSPDGLTYTFALRPNVRFSDGVPFTSADVVFSARALYDPVVNSPLAVASRIDGQPLAFEAVDPLTVRMTLPAPFAPGLRLLENLPILPRHRLESALNEGRFADAWRVGTPLTEVAGLGPFVLAEHTSGQRLVFKRNPHYWKRDAQGVPLPYLDTLTIAVIPDQNTESLRLEAGEIDLMSNADIRPEDYSSFKRAADAGRLKLLDVGVGLDPNLLWFNLSPTLRADAPWLRERAFRAAVSHAINRQAIVDTVYLGAAVPVYGPVSPGNRVWYSADAPTQPYDPARAKALLASIGVSDRNGDGVAEDSAGRPVRFSMITHKGHTLRERTAAMLQEHLRQVGIVVDIASLDPGSLRQAWMGGTYDSIFFGIQASATDPALNPDFWLSSGAFHFWHPRQPSPATEWEARIDDLMRRQAAAVDLPERQRLFAEVQRIVGEELPLLYFVAPKVTAAVSHRVGNATPVPQAPQILWAAETLQALPR